MVQQSINYRKQKLDGLQKKGAHSLITKISCRAHYVFYNKLPRKNYNHFSSLLYYYGFQKTKSFKNIYSVGVFCSREKNQNNCKIMLISINNIQNMIYTNERKRGGNFKLC